ncbi:TetR/AcrR family transcriptional regulator [Priestia megaterium]
MKKKAEERKNQILRAAFQAMSVQGYNSVTLQSIADHAEVSKGVVHYYFENKEDTLSQLLEWLTNKIYNYELASVNSEPTPLGKLKAYVNSVFVAPEKNAKFYRVYLDFLSQAGQNETYRKINHRFYQNCWDITSDIITSGQKTGVFEQNINVEKTSKTMRAIIDGLLIQWLMNEDINSHQYYKETCYQSFLHLLKIN